MLEQKANVLIILMVNFLQGLEKYPLTLEQPLMEKLPSHSKPPE